MVAIFQAILLCVIKLKAQAILLMALLLVLLLVSLQAVDAQECHPRIEGLLNRDDIGNLFDALRQVLSNGDQCKIGEYGIGPYQISEQYYNESVEHYPQLRNGGT